MIQIFRDAGYQRGQRLRGRRDAAGVPDRPDRHRDRRDAGTASTAPRPRRSSGSSTPRSVAVIGASRRQDTIGQALVRNLVLGDFTGPGVRREPERPTSVAGHAGVRHRRRHPRRRRRRDRRGAGRGGAGRRARLRRQGRARPGRDLLGLRRDRRGGPAAAAPAGRAGPLLRPAADRPQLPRHHQHRPATCSLNASLSPRDAAARPGRLLLPVRRARLGDPGEGRTTAASGSRRSSAPATAPTSPATTCCSTGRRTTPPRSCCSTSSRSATRASSAGIARRVSLRKPIDRGAVRAAPPRACRWATRSARSLAPPGGRRRDVPPGRGDPGRHPRRDVRRRPAARPPAAAARPPGRDRRQLRRARAARRRRRRRGRPRWSTSRSRSAPTPTAEDFEDALDAAIDDPEVDSVVAVYIPPLNATGEEVANVLAAVGEQSDKPLVSTFLGAEGVPELLRVPDVAGSHRRPRLGAVVPRRRGRRPRARPGRGVRRVAAHPATGEPVAPDERRPRRPRKRLVNELLIAHPDGRATSTVDELHELLGGLRHRPVGAACRSPPLDEAVAAGERARLGRRAQGHRRAPARAARPGPRVAQHRQRRPRCATPGSTLQRAHRRPRARPASSCSGTRRPGVPVAHRAAWRTRCSGRSCPSAISGPLTELLGDRSYRIPPMHARATPRDDGPRDQGRAAAVRLPRQRGGRRRRGRATCCCGSPSSRTTCRRCARST